MPDKILGIDIADGMLAVSLVSRSIGGGYRVEWVEALDIQSADGLSESLNQLRERIPFNQVAIHYSLPTAAVSFHTVRLPFREEKKISQTIIFELETLHPHSIEDCLLDYTTIIRPNGAEILAALVPRSTVQERIALLGEPTPSIRVVTIGAVAITSMLIAKRVLSGPSLLLDVGKEEVVAVFFSRGKIRQVRRYLFPFFTKHEEMDSGNYPGETGKDQEKGRFDVTSFDDDACERFFNDLVNTIEMLKWDGIMEGPSQIYFTGNGSVQPRFEEELKRNFKASIEKLDLAETDGVVLSDAVRRHWRPLAMNRALALAMNGHKKGQGFNFPLRVLKQSRDRWHRDKALRWGAAALATGMALVAVDSYLEYRYDQLRLDNLKKEIQGVFKTASPETVRIVDPVQQFKVKIAETRRITAGMGGIEGGSTVLDVVKDISNLVPPSAELLISGFNLDDSQLVIKATAKNFDVLDAIKKELSKSSYMKSVEIGSTNRLKQSERVEFDMRIMLER